MKMIYIEERSRIDLKNNKNTIKLEKNVVEKNDIIYIKSDDKYTMVTTQYKKYLVRLTLIKWEEMLDEFFIRIHRSIIINMRFVVCIENDALMEGNIRLPISTRKRKKVHEIYSKYKQGYMDFERN